MIGYERIINTAMSHLGRAEPEEQAYRTEVLKLEDTAMIGASIFEVAHALAVGMGLFTAEEQADPELWHDPAAIVSECTRRLGEREMPVEQYVAFLSTEYEFGLRVGMQLGLELAREEGS